MTLLRALSEGLVVALRALRDVLEIEITFSPPRGVTVKVKTRAGKGG